MRVLWGKIAQNNRDRLTAVTDLLLVRDHHHLAASSYRFSDNGIVPRGGTQEARAARGMLAVQELLPRVWAPSHTERALEVRNPVSGDDRQMVRLFFFSPFFNVFTFVGLTVGTFTRCSARGMELGCPFSNEIFAVIYHRSCHFIAHSIGYRGNEGFAGRSTKDRWASSSSRTGVDNTEGKQGQLFISGAHFR